MHRITGWALIIFLFSISFAFAEISLRAEVDKAALSLDDILTYKVTVNSRERNIPQPEIPEFNGFDVVSQSQSSNISFGKGDIETTLIYIFILSPNDIGKFKIEPAAIKLNNKVYTTDSFEIAVSAGKIKPKAPKKPKSSLPQEPLPESGEPQVAL